MATAAGAEIALDMRDVIDELRPDLDVVDCMLPAALAAGEAAATPTASLVHFLYGPRSAGDAPRPAAAGRRTCDTLAQDEAAPGACAAGERPGGLGGGRTSCS